MAEVGLNDVPRKARDLFDKGFAAMERGNLDYAMDMFVAALDIEPRFLHARKFLRAAQVKKFKSGKPNPLTHSIASLTGLPMLMSVSGQMAKKPQEALRTAEKLMRKDPLNMTFINAFAKAALAAELPEAALQTLEVAKDHYPQNVELLNWMGKLYTESNQTQEARLCFEEVARLRPNDPKAIKALKDAAAVDTMRKSGWGEAGSFRDVMRDNKTAVLLEQESKAVKSSQDLEDLIKEMRAKIEREPENMNYKRALADYYSRAGRFQEGLDVLKEAQLTTGRADPQIDRAISAIRIKQFDHEIETLRAAGNDAGAEVVKGKKDQFLLEDARDRVARYPNDLQFRYDLGALLFEHGELNEAIGEFQASQRNPQRRIRSLYYLAMCFKQKGQYDIAMEQLEKAASELNIMDETKKDILYEMGVIADMMGQKDKAAGYFKEIYAVDIGYKDVTERIEKAYKK